MTVNFFATLRLITGQKSVDMALPAGTTVRQLIEAIIARYPPMRTQLLDDNGELYRHVHVFVNGRDVPYLENRLETTLAPSDRVSIFPAVGGG